MLAIVPWYITRLKICGIKNIERPVELTFYKKIIDNNFDPKDYRIKAIYGENGSGKTAIITAIKILRNTIQDKDYLFDSITQRNLVEQINKKNRSAQLEMEFVSNSGKSRTIYLYQLGLKVSETGRVYISNELLQEKKNNTRNKYQIIYETNEGELIHYADEQHFQNYKEKTLNLLTQRSFVSFVLDFLKNLSPDIISITLLNVLILFTISFAIVLYIDTADDHRKYIHNLLISELKEKKLDNSTPIINFAQESELSFDASEDQMIPKEQFDQYEKYVSRLFAFVKLFKTDLIKIRIEKTEIDTAYKCKLVMEYKDYSIDSEFESKGIKKIIGIFNILDVACQGAIVFIDELDSSINDIYLNKIIEYFISYGKGQLCFTAHNLSPMSILKSQKMSITFISNINTIHTWTSNGNQSPENAYRDGFIDDSPYNIDSSDFLGVLGGEDE